MPEKLSAVLLLASRGPTTLVRMDCWCPRRGRQVARGVTVMDYEAENEKLRALLKAANERAEAQLPLPTELVPLKPAAFNAGVNL